MKEAGFPLGVLLLLGVAYITGTQKLVSIVKWKLVLQCLADLELNDSLNRYIYDNKNDKFFPYLSNPLSRLVKVENYTEQHIKLLFVCILFS